MTTEIHHGQAEANDSGAVTPAVLPIRSIPDGMTDYDYESALEATQAERARQAQAAAWDSDPDWQAFQALCYSDTETPDAAAIREGMKHLIAAARRGHAPAQCRLATELHLGEGRLGIQPNIHKAAAWFQLASKNGDPVAHQSLVVLAVTHPDITKQDSDAY